MRWRSVSGGALMGDVPVGCGFLAASGAGGLLLRDVSSATFGATLWFARPRCAGRSYI